MERPGSVRLIASTGGEMNLFWTPHNKHFLETKGIPFLPAGDGHIFVIQGTPTIEEFQRADTYRTLQAFSEVSHADADVFCRTIQNNPTGWDKPILTLSRIGCDSGSMVKDFQMHDLGIIAIVAARKIIDLARYPRDQRYIKHNENI